MWYGAVGYLVTLTLSLLTVPLAANAQPPAKVARIGFLSPRPAHDPAASQQFEALRQGLRDLGYIEGQHLTIVYRSAEDDQRRLRDLATELVRLPVDVLVTWTTPAIRVAQQATTATSILIAASGDPVSMGFIASLARPGGISRG